MSTTTKNVNKEIMIPKTKENLIRSSLDEVKKAINNRWKSGYLKSKFG